VKMGEDAESADCTMDDDCPCAHCREHGPVTALQMTSGIQSATDEELSDNYTVVTHADGTTFAWYSWGKTRRRTWIQLRTNPEGQLVPMDRGARRGEVVDDLSFLYKMGTSLPKGPLPGSGLTREKVRPLVEELVAAGMTVHQACAQVAEENGYEADYVRVTYYGKPLDGSLGN